MSSTDKPIPGVKYWIRPVGGEWTVATAVYDKQGALWFQIESRPKPMQSIAVIIGPKVDP